MTNNTTALAHPFPHGRGRRRLMATAIAGLAIATLAATREPRGSRHQPCWPPRPRRGGGAGRPGRRDRGPVRRGGYDLYLRCTGTGTPTVVMDASANEDSSTWADVEPSLASATRVCVYDRAGLGQSERGPVPRTSQTMVDDLTTLLHAADVPGPYVLVGHSIAGFNVHVFARQDGGDTVAGVVLIDATPPDIIAARQRRRCDPAALGHRGERRGTGLARQRRGSPDGRSVPAGAPGRAHPRRARELRPSPGAHLARTASGAVTALAHGAAHRRSTVRSLHPERSAEARRPDHHRSRRRGPGQRRRLTPRPSSLGVRHR